ncbi:MAG: shikimate dehydrogenase [Muribaculaceae bacterium]|nr:shikimate dehydrogenase [Muribaculaceae bacterium]
MYGLIGYPLGHSFSATFFNEKFKKENIDEKYSLFPIPSLDDFEGLINDIPNLKGLNVTIPYKQDVIKFLDNISEEARQIGAVNVIKIETKEGKKVLTGYNSDAAGFRNSILPLINSNIRKCLVLGTGGASKAVVFVLSQLGLEVTLVSRKHSDKAISYEDLTPEIISENKLIVNTTPLGMWPEIDKAPDIPYQELTSEHVLFDLVYNPSVTKFMKKGLEKGAKVKNGLEMLHGQALEAWNIWNL